jgi:serine/threonine-protein kinase
MSPEQIQGKPVDGKADQFALGVVAYEMLTGERPFGGEALTTVLYKIVSEEPPPPQHLNPTLGWPVSMVLGRALAKDPNKRYPNCTEFVNALDAALKSKKGWKPQPRGSSQSAPTVVGSPRLGTTTSSGGLAAGRRRNLVWHILAASVGALGLAGLLFVAAQRWVFNDRTEPQPQAAAAPPQTAVAPPPALEPRPSPMPAAPKLPEPPATETTPPPPVETRPAAPAGDDEAAPTRPRERPPQTRPAAAQEAAALPLQVVTSPPGATIMLDNDSGKTCQSPCSFDVAPGRHTLTFNMNGYRTEYRIVELRGEPKEQFVNLARAGGTIRVESNPPGAQIYINGQLQSQTTPATLPLAVGRYTLAVEKNGRRAEQPIEVHDGAILRSQFDLPN